MDCNTTLLIVAGFFPTEDQELPENHEEFSVNGAIMYGKIVQRITGNELLGRITIDKSPQNNRILEAIARWELPEVNPGERLFSFLEKLE